MEWQPIETVPKDGTEVDLYLINHMGEGERWCNAKWAPDWDGEAFIDSWRGPWSDGYESPLPVNKEKSAITHWMAIPQPPAR